MIEDLDGEEMIWLQLTVELSEGHTSNHTIYNNNYFLTAIVKTGLNQSCSIFQEYIMILKQIGSKILKKNIDINYRKQFNQ